MNTDPSSHATWSIADVERDTGLGKDTLRVWERRYGFPSPLRDASGERAYPLEQLQRLRLIKRLMDADYRPGKVVPLSVDELQEKIDALGMTAHDDIVHDKNEMLSPEKEREWILWLAENKTQLIKQSL